MCDAESDSINEVEAKKCKMNDNEKQGPNQVTSAELSSVEMLPLIFKMNIDCFEELFDWLSMADLLALRLTCKRFKQIINYYIKTYTQHIKCQLNDANFEYFRQMDAGSIELIKEIDVSVTSDFDGTQFLLIKDLLNKVPNIKITVWKSDSDFYNIFLKYCKNVKYLTIKGRNAINISNEWLSHRYSSLEYVSLCEIFETEIDEFETFFRLNSNIHALKINHKYLRMIESRLDSAGIKFDRLYTYVVYDLQNPDLVEWLKRLYDKQFYRRLYLSFEDVPEAEAAFLELASCGIEALDSEYLYFNIPSMQGLKELTFDQSCPFDDGQYENVKNVVERLDPGISTYEDLMPFICNFPKLKHLRIVYMWSQGLDLVALNKERNKLAGACKTTIYVDEKAFLATKWASTKTRFNLIELKRTQTCDWWFENAPCALCTPLKRA